MNEETNNENDEVSLIELFAILWKRKKLIIGITVAGAIIAVIISILSIKLPPESNFLPNLYTPKALMLINNTSSSGSLSSLIGSSGLSSLAGLMGVNLGSGQTYSELAKYLVSTNTILDSVVDRFDLMERYKIKREFRANSRKKLKENLKADYDTASGVFVINFTDYDPAFAQQVVNYCVDFLENWFKVLGLDKNIMQKTNLEQNIENTFNEIRRLEAEGHELERSVSSVYNAAERPSIVLETRRIQLELSAQQEIYRQLKVQLELTNVAIASESPIFQILQMAEIPDQKSKPSRGMLCIIVTFAAGFFSIFLAFLLNAISNIKKDPEAMAKLRGEKE